MYYVVFSKFDAHLHPYRDSNDVYRGAWLYIIYIFTTGCFTSKETIFLKEDIKRELKNNLKNIYIFFLNTQQQEKRGCKMQKRKKIKAYF